MPKAGLSLWLEPDFKTILLSRPKGTFLLQQGERVGKWREVSLYIFYAKYAFPTTFPLTMALWLSLSLLAFIVL